jgi:cell growth-regulating nucleolar protein
MVFFVCEGCNETLKKNQVDKHVGKCRNCYAVTCVDCSVTFYENDYAAHLTCVSEAEKHHGSLYVATKTKLNPQDAWVVVVESAAERATEAPASIRNHLVRMGELGNVPRNRKKFDNFVKNSLRLYDQSVANSIWAFLETIQGPKENKNKDKTDAKDASNKKEAAAEVVEEKAATETDAQAEAPKKEKKEKKGKKEKKEKKEKREKKRDRDDEPESEGKKQKKDKKEKS